MDLAHSREVRKHPAERARVTCRPTAPPGCAPALARTPPISSARATFCPPPFTSGSVKASTYLVLTWSPTFSLSKFLTFGPAVTVISLPCGSLSVTSHVALSMAVVVAVTFTVWATPTLPGPKRPQPLRSVRRRVGRWLQKLRVRVCMSAWQTAPRCEIQTSSILARGRSQSQREVLSAR